MKLPAALAALAAALTLVASGCGGGEDGASSETVAWADDFCTALDTWGDALRTAGSEAITSRSKEGLEKAADDANAATKQLVSDLRSLGAPGTESGSEVADALDSLTSTLEAERRNVEDAVAGASGLAELLGAASKVTASLTAMGSAVTSALDTIRSADVDDELEDAFREAESCDELTESSS